MNKGSTAYDGTVSIAHAKCGQMSKGDCIGKQRLGRALTHSHERRELPMLPVSTSSVMHTAHQRRWSADFSKCGSPHIITVKKNKKEPPTPQRRESLVKPHAASDSLSKRYSCPPLGLLRSPSSSSSSSSTSSCSSPTSVITGPDPLGWRLRPKSSSTNTQARTNRRSLQIDLPVVFPDHKSRPVPNSKPDNSLNQDPSLKIQPPPRAKPSRRHHSESSAFLRSLVTPLPVVTIEDLCGIHLHPIDHSDEPDDVFSDGSKVESKVTPQRKIPPPVPEKTFMARQIAKLIAQSLQRCAPVTMTTEAEIYRSAMNPKPKQAQQTDLHAPKSGLHLDTSSTPRFPGREI